MTRRLLYCLSYIFLMNSVAHAQQVVHANGQNFEEYKLNVPVTKLLIDRQGFLWAGLQNGLARFDGQDFIYYKENPLDSLGYKGQRVWDIFEDHAGGIWVGTEHGINYKAPDSRKFLHYALNVSRVSSIAEGKDSSIWLLSPTTLTKLDGGFQTDTIRHVYHSPEGVYFHRLLIVDQNIFATGNGLYELNISKDSLRVNNLLQSKSVNGIIQTNSGSVLIGIDSGFAVKSPLQSIELRNVTANHNMGVHHLDKTGRLWLSSNNGVMSILTDTAYSIREVSTYAIGRGILDIVEDRSGNLFFATNRGILKLGWNYNQYKFISLPERFHNSYVWNFIEDGDDLWIGSFDGLLRYNQEHNRYDIFKGDRGGLPHTSVYSLLQDRNNGLWIATGNGVVKYEARSGRFLPVPADGLSHHLCEDRDGFIWFVSRNKLYAFDPANWKLNRLDSVAGAPMEADQIFIDRENVLWVNSRQLKLQDFWINRGNLKPRGDALLPLRDEIGEGRVIQDDNLGQLWVSYTFGVYVIHKKSRKVVHFMNTTNSPLQQDDAFGIVRDLSGNIWLKQPLLGSICINPKTFEAIAYSPSWLYSGLFGKQGRQPACVAAVGRSGKLYTDGHGDFCVFNPDSLRINKVPPSVVLHEMKVNGQIRQGNGALQSTENSVEFFVGALHFDNPKLNRYAYFLEGFDEDWSQPTRNNEVRYSSLHPGTFNFYLKAANSDGVWSEPELLATFTILPVWWQTRVAYIIYILLGFGLVVLIYRIRMTQRLAKAEALKLKEIDDFKNQFFTNITHEFRTPLTVITGVAEKIEGQPGLLIKRNAEQLLALINQILELSKVEANTAQLNPEPVDLVHYVKYLLQSFTSLADEKAITLLENSKVEHLNTVIDKAKFSLIIQNLVTNAIKFTPPGGSINILIQSNASDFVIEVTDTGVGIDAAELPLVFNRFYQANNQQEGYKGTGIGLALTRELVQLMNGTIEVISKSGRGSTFRVSLPVIFSVSTHEIPFTQTVYEAIEHSEEHLTALLIEDNEDVATVIREILSQKYVVIQSMNGKEGVDKAIHYIPDVIISDVMMPEMNGLESTQLLKADSRTSHIPIILLTAKADIESKLSGLQHGADVYMAKPFNGKELLLHLDNLLRLREAIRLRYSEASTLPKESNHPEDKFIVSLRELVLNNLSADTYGIDEICRDRGVSRTQLHRKIKALTGKSASIFVRDIRLAEGRKMLLNNAHSVAEVAYAIGFSDPNYFSRLFSEKYGYPPTQERKK